MATAKKRTGAASASRSANSKRPNDGVPPPEHTIERAMVRVRRSMTRRTLGRLAARELQRSFDMSLIAVIDAIEQGPDPEEPDITVGVVAARLGIDPSRASRMVAAAVTSGHVARVASQRDARRIGLELTDLGREIETTFRDFRRAFFARIVASWTEQERQTFARLLDRFTTDLTRPST